jgi:hypothetical protein
MYTVVENGRLIYVCVLLSWLFAVSDLTREVYTSNKCL